MSKQAHILAVEIADPDFEGYHETDPIAYLGQGNIWLGYRPHLETLDPRAEGHPHAASILQLIPYVVLKHDGKVLTYVRPDKGNEGRLHGKASIGVGGHIDLQDVVHEDSVLDLDQTLKLSCIREIQEEIGLEVEGSDLVWKGLIVRRDKDVDRVHLGIVAEIELDDEMKSQIQTTEEIGEIRFIEPSTFADEMSGNEIEAWTKAVLFID